MTSKWGQYSGDSPGDWTRVDYSEGHPGAFSGTADPDGHKQHHTGATHPNAGAIEGASRNAYSLAPGAGQAVSAPVELLGVESNDAAHDSVLHGHGDSQLADHPNGQLVVSSVNTSVPSLKSNFDAWLAPLVAGYTVTGRGLGAQDTLSMPRDPSAPGRLLALRDARLEAEEVLVKSAAPGRSGFLAGLGAGQWDVPQLAGIGLAGYAAYSLLAR
jgi:hypothetical protein